MISLLLFGVTLILSSGFVRQLRIKSTGHQAKQAIICLGLQLFNVSFCARYLPGSGKRRRFMVTFVSFP